MTMALEAVLLSPVAWEQIPLLVQPMDPRATSAGLKLIQMADELMAQEAAPQMPP